MAVYEPWQRLLAIGSRVEDEAVVLALQHRLTLASLFEDWYPVVADEIRASDACLCSLLASLWRSDLISSSGDRGLVEAAAWWVLAELTNLYYEVARQAEEEGWTPRRFHREYVARINRNLLYRRILHLLASYYEDVGQRIRYLLREALAEPPDDP